MESEKKGLLLHFRGGNKRFSQKAESLGRLNVAISKKINYRSRKKSQKLRDFYRDNSEFLQHFLPATFSSIKVFRIPRFH